MIKFVEMERLDKHSWRCRKFIIQCVFILIMLSSKSYAQALYDENFIDKIALSEQQHRKLNTDGIVLANSGNYDLKYAKITIFL